MGVSRFVGRAWRCMGEVGRWVSLRMAAGVEAFVVPFRRAWALFFLGSAVVNPVRCGGCSLL